MTNICVIYEDVGTPTKTYLLKDVSDEEAEIIKSCHGRYINVESENHECQQLNYLISDKELFNVDWQREVGLPEESCGKYADCVIDGVDPIKIKGFDYLVVTGIADLILL